MVKKRKEDFSHYVSGVLQNSMLTGIPQIAQAGNWPKKIVRSVVFCFCVFGFVYQSLTFMWLYWEFDVVMDVQITRTRLVNAPSITICLEEGINETKVCEEENLAEFNSLLNGPRKIGCLKLFEMQDFYYEPCACNPRLCDRDKNVKNLSSLVGISYWYHLPREYLGKFMVTKEQMILSCMYERHKEGILSAPCNYSEFQEIPCQRGNDYTHERCYTLNSLIGEPNRTEEKVFNDAKIRITLGEFPNFRFFSYVVNPYYLTIHNQYQVINPFQSGIPIEPGNSYNIYLRKEVKKLLPSPYKTDCMDYRSMWRARGGRGPVDFNGCLLECQKNVSVKSFGCLHPALMYSGDDVKRCDNSKLSNRDLLPLHNKSAACAEKNCKQSCYSETYEYTSEANIASKLDCNLTLEPGYRGPTDITIDLNGMETTTYTYSPKFEDVETFSYLGGYVGMWLGISLVAVFDFLETVVAMAKFPLRRIRFFRAKKKSKIAVQELRKTF